MDTGIFCFWYPNICDFVCKFFFFNRLKIGTENQLSMQMRVNEANSST